MTRKSSLYFLFSALTAATALWSMRATAGEIFVANENTGTISAYTTSGVLINPALITGLSNPIGIAVSGSDLYVVNSEPNNGFIGKYTTSGVIENAMLIPGLNQPVGIAVSGTDLYVTNNQPAGSGTIYHFTTSGALVNTITGQPGGQDSIAVSGTDLFVVHNDIATVGKYTASGTTVNPSLISGFGNPFGIVTDGTNLFVTSNVNHVIGKFTMSGAMVNPFPLVSNSSGTSQVALFNGNLFVTQPGNGTVGEYTTSGATVNAALISGFFGSNGGIAVVPEPGTVILAVVGAGLLLAVARYRQRISQRLPS